MPQKINVLAFAAHPDDVEISISGIMIKHRINGLKTGIVDLTKGELGTRGDEFIRAEESKKASQILGLSARQNLGIKDGFITNSEENLISVVKMIRAFQPDIVLMNAESDRHPDHGKAHTLVKEACFLSGLIKLSTKYNEEIQEAWRPKSMYSYIQDYYLEPDILIDVSPLWNQRMEALLAYSSQFYNTESKELETPISSPAFMEHIKGRAIQWGRLINCGYAEGLRKVNHFSVNLLTDILP
ncbi:MAG: bacillithiol biosynthesis deacetylase BshB1 [Bacteroidota bacterium]|nr:bacillithiol biosynthesis deacetylase BshB1 [Bacteroidota bacterium]